MAPKARKAATKTNQASSPGQKKGTVESPKKGNKTNGALPSPKRNKKSPAQETLRRSLSPMSPLASPKKKPRSQETRRGVGAVGRCGGAPARVRVWL